MLTLCTLFDHNYLDKGLAMYESLEKVCDEFELYVLAMSDKCYEILVDLNYPHIKPIRSVDFEDEELLKVKPTRKVGEYCWTCSSSLIRYVLMTYNPEYCTYIDADLYFYSNPEVIIEEMKQKRASVQVIGHRFCENEKEERERIVGKYCVEFNTFKNDANGLELINIWRKQCLDHCSTDGDGVYWGDQKYQDNWCQDYSYCVETENLGAGVAPWNYTQYSLVRQEPNGSIIVRCDNKSFPLVFYHFENIQYIEKNTVQINLFHRWGMDKKLAYLLYKPYLKVVDDQKNMIKNRYGLEILIKSHPGTAKCGWKQKLFRKRGLADIRKMFYVVLPTKLFYKWDIIHL